MARQHRNGRMHVSYAEDVRLLAGRWHVAGLVALIAVYALAPFVVTDFWLLVLSYAGIAAIGAVGLNLLTGSTGQVSLGHAAFLGVGAYTAGWLGADLGLPFPLWLIGAALAGGLIGGVVGPFALRLRGDYLAIITLGLVFVGQHVYLNWDDLTGGPSGRAIDPAVSVGPVDFNALGSFTREQSFFWLIWAFVAVAVLIAVNLLRTRPGRAMQAVRDRDVAAEIIGVSLTQTKIGAFVVSSALAAVAGALYATLQEYVSPSEWALTLSIQYLAIIIVGGLGTVSGAVLGALLLGSLPRVIEEFSGSIPFVATSAGDTSGLITVFALNQAIFGLLIVLFLVFEPRGLVAVWRRARTYAAGWPFSY